MSWEAIAIMFATLFGPVAAVQAQKFIEWATEQRNAKKRIFQTLMATRAATVSIDHVQALNRIDLEFTRDGWTSRSPADKEVVRRWRVYSDHLNQPIPGDIDEKLIDRWIDKKNDLFIDLLEAMAKATGYDFDRVLLTKGIYVPRAHSDAERKREVFETLLMNVLQGRTPLAMNVLKIPELEELAALLTRNKVQNK